MAKHTIRILNYNLTLTSDDDKSYIENIAKKVEQNTRSLSDAMPTRNMTEVALFVAMDYCDRYMKSVNDGAALRNQIKDYLKDTSRVRQQLVTANAEIEQLRKEIAQLKGEKSENTPAAPEKPAEEPEKEQVKIPSRDIPAPAPTAPVPTKEGLFGKKKKKKKKKKENKQTAPRNVWGADTNSESADAAVDIMSFFEQHAVDDED